MARLPQRPALTPVSPLVGPGLSRPWRWLASHPFALDIGLSAGSLLVILIAAVAGPNAPQGPIDWAFVLFSALASASLALRRRMPRTVLAVTCALALAELVTEGNQPPRTSIVFAVVVALYTVAARTDRPTTWRIGAVTVALLTGAGMLFGMRPWYAQENLGIFAWTAFAAAAGDALRSRRAFVAAIQERAVRAERTREEEARRRVAEERLRIARELHDVVAHHIALVNVQAGVASHVMDSRPDQAKQALAHVREASRSALDELRVTVGLLRQYGDPAAPTEPAPGLGMLDQLVEGFRRAGLRVEVETLPRSGLGRLATPVDLTAYRVVQEGLTNVHKHAGPRATARVSIQRTRRALEITVLDDGGAGQPGADAGASERPATRSPADEPSRAPTGADRTAGSDRTARGDRRTSGSERAAGSDRTAGDGGATGAGGAARPGERADERSGGGLGLVGMRERIAALRGECEAGPRPEGGFRVRARLPLRADNESI